MLTNKKLNPKTNTLAPRPHKEFFRDLTLNTIQNTVSHFMTPKAMREQRLRTE